ncbi:MAG: nucleotidyl transferase AbiEii/AbiGii toxin family protein [Streptosporangiaceae bacterium]
MNTGLGREDIRALLDDLSAELAARGARAELFLVGGAAMAVAYDAARATRDLDAVFVPYRRGPASGDGGSGTPGARRGLAERRGEWIPARPRPGRTALLLK